MRSALRFGILAAATLAPLAASAQSLIVSGIPGCDFQTGNLSAGCIPAFIGHVIGVVFALCGAICLIMIMIGGYQYALGAAKIGSEEEGKSRIKFGIVGFLVSALAYLIVEFIVVTLTT